MEQGTDWPCGENRTLGRIKSCAIRIGSRSRDIRLTRDRRRGGGGGLGERAQNPCRIRDKWRPVSVAPGPHDKTPPFPGGGWGGRRPRTRKVTGRARPTRTGVGARFINRQGRQRPDRTTINHDGNDSGAHLFYAVVVVVVVVCAGNMQTDYDPNPDKWALRGFFSRIFFSQKNKKTFIRIQTRTYVFYRISDSDSDAAVINSRKNAFSCRTRSIERADSVEYFTARANVQ